MSPIVIGASGGKRVSIDLEALLRTRLLIQANSGGGKSRTLRRLAEQLWDKVQVIIIDPEGEFSTLREVADYLLVGKGGDTPADTRTAGLVATKLLELRVSAVCDLYEMRAADRHAWVAAFLSAMVSAPKSLWHPVVVIIDEAHVFAPEKGQGESVASGAVADLATLGRKRGFCAVLATQRLGKLSKNVAAEMQNVFIGPTFLDVDQDRAVTALGISRAEEREFRSTLKVMEPGNFYALGRAIATTRTLLKVGDVKSTHPEPGHGYQGEPPPPTASIRKLFPQLADLPQQAEQKLRTEADLRAEVTRLRTELAKRPAPKVETKTVVVEAIPAGLAEEQARAIDAIREAQERLLNAERALKRIAQVVARVGTATPRPNATPVAAAARTVRAHSVPPPPRSQSAPRPTSALGRGQRLVLSAIAQHPTGVTREQLTVLTGYKRSSRDTYLQHLAAGGLVESRGDVIVATSAGVAELGEAFEPLPTGDALREHWLGKLPKGERVVLEAVIAAHPGAVSRDAISTTTGYLRSSRDTYLQKLASRRLVICQHGGAVSASSELFG